MKHIVPDRLAKAARNLYADVLQPRLRNAREALGMKIAGSHADTCIQWKGTQVCLGLYCLCGARGHIDDDFTYALECDACHRTYELGTAVTARLTKNPLHTPKLVDSDKGADRWKE